MTQPVTTPDEDLHKGAVEDDPLHPESERPFENAAFNSQLGHRDQDEMLKDNDTDFPEPDAEGEHTGEKS
jgi:hypothetical protein